MGNGKGSNMVAMAVLPASAAPRFPAAFATYTRRIDQLLGVE